VVSRQPKPPGSAGFCLGGCWPAGEWFRGSYAGKRRKPELLKKSEMATRGIHEVSLSAVPVTKEAFSGLVPFIVFSKVSFFSLEC